MPDPNHQPPLTGPPAPLWPAAWITHTTAFTEPTGVYHFRKSFELASVPASFKVRVSADNRYELFCNGGRVSIGPDRGDVSHWRYETLDLAPHLKPGMNVLAAVVWFLRFDLAPMAQMGHAPGFILCGELGEPPSQAVNTPNGWKCFRNPAYAFVPLDRQEVPFYTVVGPQEKVDFNVYPWGWEQPEFDDSGWDNPQRMAPGTPRGARDGPGPWFLTPTLLPPQQQDDQIVQAVVRSEGVIVENHALNALAPVTIWANSKASLLLDNTVLTTGYPELLVTGGRGAKVRLKYAEALWGGPNRNVKGHRNQIEGKVIRGYHDEFIADGPTRIYRPLWWRTFRYLQVEVETATEPLRLERLTNVFTAYPFTEKGRFSASDDSLQKIWDVGWRTARLCAHESYMDCPYYEQLQYGGDTRIQCLVSLYVGGDDRLVRNAIAQLDDSRIPEGITQSRYPSRLPQIIPPFALWWVGMIHDFFMFRDDPAFVRAHLPGARATLEWFIGHMRDDDLLGPLPWWNFVDWARLFQNGVPPGVNEGGSAILSLQLVLALRETAEMEKALGLPENATRYSRLAERVVRAVRSSCWDEGRGLLADTPKKDRFSQHANILGILTDTLTGPRARPVGEKLEAMHMTASERRLPENQRQPADPKTQVAQATFYFRFYLHRALRKVGLGDRYLSWLQPWRDMLAVGLTTWAEEPEPTRSDCHAWSAHPNVDLLATVLGVEPASPGFKTVRIAPHLGALEWAEGVVPHSRGEITVKLRRGRAGLRAEVTLPEGVTGSFMVGERTRGLRSGPQMVEL